MVKSAKRSFTVTVRPLRPFRSNELATPTAFRSTTLLSSVSSPTSLAKVVSEDMDLVARSVCTSSSSRPMALSRTLAARWPNILANHSSGCSANWPMVSMPSRCSRSAVLGPMPHSLFAAKGAKNAASSPGWTTTRPSGLSRSEPIFATVLQVPTPTDRTSPVSSKTRRLRSRAMASGFWPAVTTAVISR